MILSSRRIYKKNIFEETHIKKLIRNALVCLHFNKLLKYRKNGNRQRNENFWKRKSDSSYQQSLSIYQIKLLIQWHETLSFSYYITLRLKIMKILEHLLCPDKSVKQVVTPPPMISYRNARNLSSYLARVNHLERKRGSY